MRNKALVKYLCEIGGIDFYTVPDHARGILRGEDKSAYHYAPNFEISLPRYAYLDIWCVGADGQYDKMYPPFKINRTNGSLLIDSEAGEDVILARAGKPHDNKLFVCCPMLLTEAQFKKAKALEAANDNPA